MNGVRAVRIEPVSGQGMGTENVRKLLHSVRDSIQSLSLLSCALDIQLLASFQQLRRLWWTNGRLLNGKHSPNLSLPSLQQLQLLNVTIPTPSLFFSPNFLPRLYLYALRPLTSSQ